MASDASLTTIVLQAVTIGGVAWALNGISNINRRLRDLNGSVTALKQWKEDQKDLCDERHRVGNE